VKVRLVPTEVVMPRQAVLCPVVVEVLVVTQGVLPPTALLAEEVIHPWPVEREVVMAAVQVAPT